MALRAGFIGLGNIGKPMARRLVAAGLETIVLDALPAPVEELVREGAKAARTPRDLAERADVIGVCVRDDTDVRAVLGGDDGLLARAVPGSVIALHSTILPSTVREVGGAALAVAGKLTYMVGGDAEKLERCRPVFETAAAKIIHTGPLGTGAATKLCNNLMTYLGWLSAYESFKLARGAGLSQEKLEEVTRSNGNFTDPMLAFLALHKMPEETRKSSGVQAILRGFATLAEKDLAVTLAFARVRRRAPGQRARLAAAGERVRTRGRREASRRTLNGRIRRSQEGARVVRKGDGLPAPPLQGDAFFDVTLDHLFANVWSRPALGVRERRVATLVVLMCLGHEATLELHLTAALKTGQLTDVEVDELVVHVAHYAGWPVAAVTSQVVCAIRAERAGAKAGG